VTAKSESRRLAPLLLARIVDAAFERMALRRNISSDARICRHIVSSQHAVSNALTSAR